MAGTGGDIRNQEGLGKREVLAAQGNRISKVYQERTQEIVVPSSAFKFDTV
jgi:hypothetical protein